MNQTLIATALMIATPVAFATDAPNNDELADMSDPLAVFTQVGGGASDKGINIKIGQTYDTGSDVTMGMNIVEVKGIYGDMLGWSGGSGRDDSIDSFRYRNFTVDMTNGRGKQIDVVYEVESESLDASYSFIQALPKIGALQLYPLAGVGVNVTNGEYLSPQERHDPVAVNDADSGYHLNGSWGLVGMYSKYAITDKLWLNYNPMYTKTLSGSGAYRDYRYGDDNLLSHEVALSYQITPRLNVRYFANWDENVDFNKGDHRIEFNYQL